MLSDIPHLVNKKQISTQGRKLPVYNPATGEVISEVCVADQKLVDETVQTAKKAFETWSQTTPQSRSKILFRYKSLLDQEVDNLAEIVTREHGKTLIEAKGSVQRGIDVLEFACGIPGHLQGTYTTAAAKGINTYSMRQPLGVCAGISPFNFPAMIPLWMFPMAIGCGNTFILKPSEKNPSCSMRMVEIAHEAGVPEGVVNVLNGDKETVDAILTHPEIQAVSFVGSSTVAKHVYETSIAHNKRAQAFGGAKNHCIVMPDANLEKAADAITLAAYGSSGERCMAISVAVVIGDDLGDQLVDKIKQRADKLKVGAGHLPGMDLGPLITKEHLAKVLGYIDLGVKEGAKLVVDHRQVSGNETENGFFMGPCLFDHVKENMKIHQDEIFGPVLCIVRMPDLDSAIKLINRHQYGNGTAIFTNNGLHARQFAEQVQAGMVGINIPVPVPMAYHSFGGWKDSIFADTQMYGSESIRFFTKLKTVTERWIA